LRCFCDLSRGQNHRPLVVNTGDNPSVESGPWMSEFLIGEFLRDKHGCAKSDDSAALDGWVALKNSGNKCGMAKEFPPNLVRGFRSSEFITKVGRLHFKALGKIRFRRGTPGHSTHNSSPVTTVFVGIFPDDLLDRCFENSTSSKLH
jgi:hypothetical protein